jgi:hypothetical protein
VILTQSLIQSICKTTLLQFLFRLSSKEIAFNEERSVLFSNWKSAVSDLQDWLTKQEKKLTAQGDLASDLESIRKQKITLEVSASDISS